MSDADDPGKAIEIWLAAFQDTQRQMAEAHAAYQAAMAEGHRSFIEAIRESQRRLADVLDGKVEPEELAQHLRESGVVELNHEEIETIRETIDLPSRAPAGCRRFVVSSEKREATGLRLERLGDHRLAIVSDGMGVAPAAARLLRGAGVECILCEQDSDVPDDARAVLHLGSIYDYESNDGALTAVRDAALLAERLDLSEGLFVAAFDNGGRFGLDAMEAMKAPAAGMAAVVKVLAGRAPGASLKWIDLDVGYRSPEKVAEQLVTEMLEGGDENVGMPESERVVRMLEETEVEASSWRFDGVLLMSVSNSASCLQTVRAISEIGSPRVIFVGDEHSRGSVEEVASAIEHRWITAEHDDLIGIFDALEKAREGWGPIGALVHANVGDGGRLDMIEETIGRRLLMLQLFFAATAGDPITRFAILSTFASAESEAIADEMLRKVALAERDRRADECVVKAITIDGSAETAKGFWEEWSRDHDSVEIYLQDRPKAESG